MPSTSSAPCLGRRRARALASVLVALLACLPAAHATDKVTFNVTGNVTLTTCEFASANVDFPLGNVDAGVFTGIGTASAFVEKSLISRGCTGVTKLLMRFQATPDPNNSKYIAVTGGAKGVAVDLQSFDNLPAVPDNTTAITWNPRADGAGYAYKARYIQTAASVTPGVANATVVVNITYE